MSRHRRVMVTGARGFIGRHLVPLLADDGWQVVEHSLELGDLKNGLDPGLHCDHVVHLAARSYVPDSWKDPAAFYQTNVLGTLQVLEYCRREGTSLTFVSSYLYGRNCKIPTDELEAVCPENPYAHSKHAAEEIVRFYAAQFGVRSTTIRPFNIYGPGQAAHFLIPGLIEKYLDPAVEEVTILDDRPKRDYLFVGDFVDLVKRTIECTESEVFNAGSGVASSPRDVIEAIESALGTRKPLRVLGQVRPNEILETRADTSKADRMLGWRARVQLEEGIGITAQAARAGRLVQG